jgi:hypothetical protein
MPGHQPHPRLLSPREPPARSLHPLAPQEPPTRPLRAPATLWPSAVGPLRSLATLRPSTAGPHRSKPQERPPFGVERLKCPTNKNNDKIYQMKQ